MAENEKDVEKVGVEAKVRKIAVSQMVVGEILEEIELS